MNIECRKVRALMSLYIDDALSDKLKMFVYNHLQKCKPCMETYEQLKKTMQSLKENFQKIAVTLGDKPVFDVVKYEQFKENASAYFDNELSGGNIIDFKRYIKKEPVAQDFYTKNYKINLLIHQHFKNNAPVLTKDFSKEIVKKLQKKDAKTNWIEIFLTILFAFFLILSIYLSEKILIPQTSVPREKITLEKIKGNLLKVNFKNFIY